eukprot:gene8006-10850_t
MNRNDSIKRSGQMLLSGWRMLATTCPICMTALLSKVDKYHCPGCDMPVMFECELSSIPHDEDKSLQLPVCEDKPPQDLRIPNSLEDVKRDYDLKNKNRNEVSNKLGEKMLSGWTLTGQLCSQSSCEGTPLMRINKGPWLCVRCENEYVESEYNGQLVVKDNLGTMQAQYKEKKSSTSLPMEDINQYNQSELDMELTRLNMNDAPILNLASFSKYESIDTSMKISRKLMQGWALLEECCQSENCNNTVPLMRDHEGKKRCVECENIDINPNISTIKASKAPINHNRRQRVLSEGDDDDDNDEMLDDELLNMDEEDLHPSTNKIISKVQTKIQSNVAAVSSRKSESNISNSTITIEIESLRILREKLRDTTLSLDSCNDTSKCIEKTSLIIKLCEAIKLLQNLTD